ncbi:MAG: CaiB/BaiF CoA-transferase family protein, partial [Chloroflexota bacterium]
RSFPVVLLIAAPLSLLYSVGNLALIDLLGWVETAPEDQALALRLIARADILVESFRPGIADKLGVGYATVSRTNPGLIYCSVTGFGADGPLAGMPAHDLSLQGLSGLMAAGPARDSRPPVPGFQSADYAAAAFAAIGVLAAYVRRIRTGRGCRIDIPMYDSLMSWSNIVLAGAMARLTGASGQPALEVWGGNPRYDTYLTRDGKTVTVALLEGRTWRRFCDFIGQPELVSPEEGWSERHSDHGDRAPVYREAIAAFCRAHERDALAEIAVRAELPICPVYSPDEALRSPEALAREIVQFTDHPVDGRMPFFADPLARAGLSDPGRRPAPGLGQHGEEIRRELGPKALS